MLVTEVDKAKLYADAFNAGHEQGKAEGREKVLDEVKNSIHEIYTQNLHCKADMCERETMGYDCEDCLATFLMGYIEDVMKAHK